MQSKIEIGHSQPEHPIPSTNGIRAYSLRDEAREHLKIPVEFYPELFFDFPGRRYKPKKFMMVTLVLAN